jgi:ribosomal protein S18 acetylase RimI-like enzyme
MVIASALERPVEEQRVAFNRAFADYLTGGKPLDLPGFGDILVTHGVSLPRSLLALAAGQVVGFAYICVFGPVTRLAIMGVIPGQRRRGVARDLLAHVIAAARRLHQDLLTLEVIEENEAARRLYESAGMRPRRRLFGYSRDCADGRPAAAASRRPVPLGLAAAAGRLIADDELRLPYQVSGHAVARGPEGCTAFGLESASVVIQQMLPERVILRAMADTDPGRSALRRLLATLMTDVGGQEWRIPQILPEELGATVLEPLGFTRLPLNQLQMEIPLAP